MAFRFSNLREIYTASLFFMAYYDWIIKHSYYILQEKKSAQEIANSDNISKLSVTIEYKYKPPKNNVFISILFFAVCYQSVCCFSGK